MRVDYWLRREYPQLTRRHVIEALASGLVRAVNGARAAPGDTVEQHACLDCSRLEAHLTELLAGTQGLPVKLLLETSGLVAVDKPAGLPGHPLSLLERNTVTHWAFAKYPEIQKWARACQPTITPHRIDTDTSGALLVALTEETYTHWRACFSQGSVEKTYLAWCWGRGPTAPFVCDAPLIHTPGDSRRMSVHVSGHAPRGAGRIFAAETHIRTLRQESDHFLAEIRMVTGVTHQIRAHMASLDLPLMGDSLYDKNADGRAFAPGWHQLRCVQIRCGDFSVNAPSVPFTDVPGAEARWVGGS